jgi:hypothetical protein
MVHAAETLYPCSDYPADVVIMPAGRLIGIFVINNEESPSSYQAQVLLLLQTSRQRALSHFAPTQTYYTQQANMKPDPLAEPGIKPALMLEVCGERAPPILQSACSQCFLCPHEQARVCGSAPSGWAGLPTSETRR